MTKAVAFNVDHHTVGIDPDLTASLVDAQPDPPVPMRGMTFGVATMQEDSPHAGEMHPDGDEILYLVAGRVRIELENDDRQELVMTVGDAVVVPRGVWHRVRILEPATIVYLTPGPNNQFRPIE